MISIFDLSGESTKLPNKITFFTSLGCLITSVISYILAAMYNNIKYYSVSVVYRFAVAIFMFTFFFIFYLRIQFNISESYKWAGTYSSNSNRKHSESHSFSASGRESTSINSLSMQGTTASPTNSGLRSPTNRNKTDPKAQEAVLLPFRNYIYIVSILCFLGVGVCVIYVYFQFIDFDQPFDVSFPQFAKLHIVKSGIVLILLISTLAYFWKSHIVTIKSSSSQPSSPRVRKTPISTIVSSSSIDLPSVSV